MLDQTVTQPEDPEALRSFRESRSSHAGFFCGSHLSQFAEATWWKPATSEATQAIQIVLDIRAGPTGRGASQARPEYLLSKFR